MIVDVREDVRVNVNERLIVNRNEATIEFYCCDSRRCVAEQPREMLDIGQFYL
jgi:hypothetical protein